jgi:aryl-alcohol dehydrogenase-like predicted oxidoreductase
VEYRSVGRSGLNVSLAGLGCSDLGNRLDDDASAAVVHRALELGVTFFDTADSYSGGRSEELLGRLLRHRRDEVVIATKFGTPTGRADWQGGASRRWIVRAVEDSLRRLGTDRIDLYQLHYPDPVTPVEETLAALDDLVHQGKVRYVGSSNLMGWQVTDADWLARTHGWNRFVSAQNEWSLLEREVERDLVPACGHLGIGVIPYHPLAAGVLGGRYRPGVPHPPEGRVTAWPDADHRLADERLEVVERLRRFAARFDRGLAELSLAWLAAHREVCSVISGASSPEQVAANVRALEWELDQRTVYDAVFVARGQLDPDA